MLGMRASGVVRPLPPTCKIRLDKGDEGTDAASPHNTLAQPLKKKRGQPQHRGERAYNSLLSTHRLYVEHHVARLKQWDCFAQLWRGKGENPEDVFWVIAGLRNFRQRGRMERGGENSAPQGTRLSDKPKGKKTAHLAVSKPTHLLRKPS